MVLSPRRGVGAFERAVVFQEIETPRDGTNISKLVNLILVLLLLFANHGC
jgi:hypothetical protein